VLLGWLGHAERALLTFASAGDDALAEGASGLVGTASSGSARDLAAALAALVDTGRRPALLVSTVDGVEATRSPLAGAFVQAGFAPTRDGLHKRRARPLLTALVQLDADQTL
jgi:hypothetical protein